MLNVAYSCFKIKIQQVKYKSSCSGPCQVKIKPVWEIYRFLRVRHLSVPVRLCQLHWVSVSTAGTQPSIVLNTSSLKTNSVSSVVITRFLCSSFVASGPIVATGAESGVVWVAVRRLGLARNRFLTESSLKYAIRPGRIALYAYVSRSGTETFLIDSSGSVSNGVASLVWELSVNEEAPRKVCPDLRAQKLSYLNFMRQ